MEAFDYVDRGIVGVVQRHFNADVADAPKRLAELDDSGVLDAHAEITKFLDAAIPNIEDPHSAVMLEGMAMVDMLHDAGDMQSLSVQEHQVLLTQRQMIVQLDMPDLSGVSHDWPAYARREIQRLLIYIHDFRPLIESGLVQPVRRPAAVADMHAVLEVIRDAGRELLMDESVAPEQRERMAKFIHNVGICIDEGFDLSSFGLTLAEISLSLRVGVPCHFRDPDTLQLHVNLTDVLENSTATRQRTEVGVLREISLPGFKTLHLDDLVRIRRDDEAFARVRGLQSQTAVRAGELARSKGIPVADAYLREEGPLREEVERLNAAVLRSPALAAGLADIKSLPQRIVGEAVAAATAPRDVGQPPDASAFAAAAKLLAESTVGFLCRYVALRKAQRRDELSLRVLRAGLLGGRGRP